MRGLLPGDEESRLHLGEIEAAPIVRRRAPAEPAIGQIIGELCQARHRLPIGETRIEIFDGGMQGRDGLPDFLGAIGAPPRREIGTHLKSELGLNAVLAILGGEQMRRAFHHMAGEKRRAARRCGAAGCADLPAGDFDAELVGNHVLQPVGGILVGGFELGRQHADAPARDAGLDQQSGEALRRHR